MIIFIVKIGALELIIVHFNLSLNYYNLMKTDYIFYL